MAPDTNGNLFIADYGNHVVRKVGTNGVATIIAGTGSASFSGDGGAATNAGLFFPMTVIVDSAGNLFIADSFNNRIRKVDTNGVISTVAGNGSTPSFGSPVGDNGAATNAEINTPEGICLDTNGNLFIADTVDQRIRKVATNGIITTVAGNGTAGYGPDNFTPTSSELNNPTSVTMDSSNNLYIADSANSRIRKVNTFITTVADTGTAGYSGDGGAATSAKINNPLGVALDAAARNLFIVDNGNYRVRKMTNNIITTVAGSGTNGYSGDGGLATNANLSFVQNVSVDMIGNLFIADAGNNLIRKLGTNGIISTVAGRILNDGDFATNATLYFAYGTAFDTNGNLYIADANNNRIRKVDTNGIISTVAGDGIAAYSGDGGVATNASLNHPYSIAPDTLGNLFIADRNNFRIRKVDTNGNISTVAGTGSAGFSGDGGAATNAKISSVSSIAVDAVGNCFMADAANERIRKVDASGNISTMAGTGSFGFSGDGGAATNATFINPSSVALDSAGNFYIVDGGNARIRKINTNGIISTVAGNGSHAYSGDGGAATNASFVNPIAVTVDSVGNIFISDSFNMVVRKVGTNGIIITVAGNGVQGFAGDGGAASNARLSAPRGLAADSLGNVFISDAENNRIRKVSYVDYADQASFTVTNITPGRDPQSKFSFARRVLFWFIRVMTIRALEKEVLELPPKSRARFAEKIIESIDDYADPEIEKAWTQEIGRRVAEIKSCKAKAILAQEAMAKARRALHETRRLSPARR
jgi:putative addiction module component (TIGR02574 family)